MLGIWLNPDTPLFNKVSFIGPKHPPTAIPFILSGYGITKFLSISKNLKSKMRMISLIGGSILLLTGILILTNVLQIIGFYLLEIFPFLENFG